MSSIALVHVGFLNILAASAAILHRIRKGRIVKKPKRRRYWVHPIFVERREKSQFFTVFESYYHHHLQEFFGYTRMTTSSFDKLFAILELGLTKKIGVREPIGAKERLVVTLYFLGQDL